MKAILIISTFTFLGITSNVFGQTDFNKSDVNKIALKYARQITKGKRVEGELVGYGGIISYQYKQFENLTQNSSAEELYELTNHPDPKVRCYAYWGLIEKKSDRLIDVLKKNENDTTIIEEQFGCIVTQSCVIDFMVQMTDEEQRQKLTKDDLDFIDRQQKLRIDRNTE